MKVIRAVLTAAALSAGLGAPLHAQLFGLAPEGARENERDVYRLRVRQEVTGLLGNLKSAWDGDDAKKAADLYTREGVLMAGGDEARSRPAVLARLQQLLSASGPLQFSLQDFDTSGDMAFVRGIMSYAPAAGDGAPLVASYVLIARRQRGDEWLIRSLTLSPAPPPPAPAAASAN